MDDWVERELDGGEYPDNRLKTRLAKLLGDLGRRIGATVPMACQDWAAAKAAYRFFNNPRVDEGLIPAGHFAATKARFAGTTGPTLVLHDTTEFSFTRENPEAIGQISIIKGRHGSHTICGVLLHSSLVLTTEGVPLGLAAVKFWTRKKFKGTKRVSRKDWPRERGLAPAVPGRCLSPLPGAAPPENGDRHRPGTTGASPHFQAPLAFSTRSNALKKTVNPTRIPIEQKESVRWLETMTQSNRLPGEPSRCVHIGDRESDIFELFCAAEEAKTHFLVRTCVDRLAGEGDTTISEEMEAEPIRGDHEVEVRDDHGRISTAKVHLRFCRMTVHPPIGKHRRYPALSLTVSHAHEDGTPERREPIRWKLLTDLPVEDLARAIEKLDWYAQRWKIETFHKVLKSGRQAEQSKLRTAERLTNLLAMLCIVGWRVFWLTMVNRATPEAPAEVALTRTEIEILDRTAATTEPPSKPTISHYLTSWRSRGWGAIWPVRRTRRLATW